MAEAINESIVDSFTLKPILTDEEKQFRMRNPRKKIDISIFGQIKGINKDFIFLEINDEHYAEYVRNNCDRLHFDIYFQLNLTTFQLQHNALEWIVRHGLFDLLVNSLEYNRTVDTTDYPLVDIDYEFR